MSRILSTSDAVLIESTVKKILDGTALVKTTNDAFKEVAGSAAKVGELAAMVGGHVALSTAHSRTLKRPKAAGHAWQTPQR